MLLSLTRRPSHCALRSARASAHNGCRVCAAFEQVPLDVCPFYRSPESANMGDITTSPFHGLAARSIYIITSAVGRILMVRLSAQHPDPSHTHYAPLSTTTIAAAPAAAATGIANAASTADTRRRCRRCN